MNRLSTTSQIHFLLVIQKEILPQQNWNRQWEESFEPVIIENAVVVRAHFHSPIENILHEIVITPKMSFGTGHHATTFLMIQQMLSLNFKNKHVFDFGTGTGILAIFAEMLGAFKVQAIDIDEWSITNAKENIAANNCSRIELLLSASTNNIDSYDIILANINKNVILTTLPSLAGLLNAGGTMLLSGLLQQDEKEVLDKCTDLNLLHIATFSKEKWICLLLKVPLIN